MARNPVEEYFALKEGSERKERDFSLWTNWNDNGRSPEHLEPLVRVFTPMVNQAMVQFRAPTVQKSAFEAQLTRHLIGAFETYDPSKAALPTHVHRHLMRVQRYNNRLQNMAYIPEPNARQIGKIQRAKSDLEDDLGRLPTNQEIAKHLGMPTKKLDTILTSMRGDIMASSFESDPTKFSLSRREEVLAMMPPELNPDELDVFNHLYGQGGKTEITSTNTLAAKLGKSPSQISRLKGSIAKKVQRFM